jgi:REP element-mobilizing transposase RayT
MDPDQTMSSIMKLLKGESSFWMNKKHPGTGFAWQTEYYAVSVSPVGLNRVREYIRNQEEHHRMRTFLEEYKTLMQEFGFGKFD